MKKTNYLVLLFLSTVFATFIFLYTRNSPPKDQNTPNIQIITSFYPLAEFAQNIAGDKATVRNIIPAGTEPHTFDPTPQDIAALTKATLFIYNGAGFESWIPKIQKDLETNNVVILDTSKNIELIEGSEEEEPAVEESQDEHLKDPHFWLDPIYAQNQVDSITTILVQIDPDNQQYYHTSAEQYKEKLTELHLLYTQTLSSCRRRDVIASHNAFGYLAKRYNFNIMPISGLSPDQEPSPQKLAEISNFAKKNQIKYIFFESLVSPRLSDTIAKEVGAQTLVFNPLEGLTPEEVAEGKNYITIQEQNVQNIKTALECQ